MHRYPKSAGAVFAVVAMLSSAACSSGEKVTGPTASASPSELSLSEPGIPGISPAGVTTRVAAPSAATESQYGQACLAAKRWMDGQGGDPKTLVEPYLKILQAPDFSDPGNFNSPWVLLTPGEQAGVITAANAAANGECG